MRNQPTVLYHHDLNLRNILVDDEGRITAIVDWECVSVLPIWMTSNMPQFLEGDDRSEEPVRHEYADETPSEAEAAAAADKDDPDKLNNEGKNTLHWEHQMEYEATHLRDVYRTKLKRLWPEWPIRDYDFRVEFYNSLLQCNVGIWPGVVSNWIDKIERGNVIELGDASDFPSRFHHSGVSWRRISCSRERSLVVISHLV